MTHPRLMLLDEPSDGIMPMLVNQIAEILVQINRNEKMAIVVVEQNVPMVFAMTDRCVIIEKGRIVAEGSRQEVSQSEVMREYLAI
jgi:ABC-type branched-subunit amino acid transport system ATPase component